jgi:hypothetical protein
MNELYVQKLIRLIKSSIITVDDIKDPAYKAEVENRLVAT